MDAPYSIIQMHVLFCFISIILYQKSWASHTLLCGLVKNWCKTASFLAAKTECMRLLHAIGFYDLWFKLYVSM